MRRIVRYKKRQKFAVQPKVDYRKKLGHRYEDFKEFMEGNSSQRVVEMDTVEGTKSGKLLQTFLFRESNPMLAYLIDSKEMKNTVGVFDCLEECLETEMFQEVFPVILTDNGSEFADPELFETGKEGKQSCIIVSQENRNKREN